MSDFFVQNKEVFDELIKMNHYFSINEVLSCVLKMEKLPQVILIDHRIGFEIVHSETNSLEPQRVIRYGHN